MDESSGGETERAIMEERTRKMGGYQEHGDGMPVDRAGWAKGGVVCKGTRAGLASFFFVGRRIENFSHLLRSFFPRSHVFLCAEISILKLEIS